MRHHICVLVLLLALWCCSCQSKDQSNPKEQGGTRMKIKVTSKAWAEGGMIPVKYTGDGGEVSPPLAWESVPQGAKSISLICDDPDAPRGDWVHWVLYNLPPEVKELPEGVTSDKKLSNGGMHGLNDFHKFGYNGPCPPGGTHRYFFKLYALDTVLNLQPGATKAQLLKAMHGHLLAEGQLMGKYKRG